MDSFSSENENHWKKLENPTICDRSGRPHKTNSFIVTALRSAWAVFLASEGIYTLEHKNAPESL